MAIEKNSFKVSRLDSEFSSRSRESMSSEDDDDFQRPTAVESGGDDEEEDEEDEFEDCDSGAGSDDFDLLELGEMGEEFCQVGEQTCSIPFELYDLHGLCDILSMDVWNEVLSEEERMGLAKYLPDMDQESFLRTMKELFTGCNLHFGSPTSRLFDMLKGGQCEPRVALYRQGLGFFQKRQHYHVVRKHHNAMVTNLYQIRDAWLNCRGYSIDEKLRVLNIMKSQKSLMYEKMEELETESSEREESGDGLWSNKKMKDRTQKRDHYSGYRLSPTLDFPSRGRQMAFEQAKYGKQNPKGTLKVSGSKMLATKESGGHFPSVHHPLDMKSGPYGSASGLPRQMSNQIRGEDEEEEMFEVTVQRDRNFPRIGAMGNTGDFKVGKKYDGLRGDEYTDSFVGLPVASKNDLHAFGRNRTVNQLSDIKVLTTKPSNTRFPYDYGKKLKHPENVQQLHIEDQIRYGKARALNLSLKGTQTELTDGAEQFWHSKAQGEYGSVDPSLNYANWNIKTKKGKIVKSSPDLIVNDKLFPAEHHRTKPSMEKSRGISIHNGGRVAAAAEGMRMLAKGEETESDSSEQFDEDDDDNPLMRSKWAYPSGVSNLKSGPDPKKVKFFKKDKKGFQALDGPSQISRKYSDFGERERSHLGEGESFSLKAKQKGKMHDGGRFRGFEDKYLTGPGRLNPDDHQEEFYRLGRNGQLQGDHGERFDMASLKAYSAGKRQKGEVGRDCSVLPSSYLHEYITDEPDSTLGRHQFMRDNGVSGRLSKKGQIIEAYGHDRPERSGIQLLGCSSVSKKRKVKDDSMYMEEQDDLHSSLQQQLDDITSKKRGKRKFEDENNCEKGASEPPVTETVEEDVDLESKSQKKPFTLITPSVHTGFSFSIIHLLSAVRMAMITLLPEDSLDIGKPQHVNDGRQNLQEEQDRKLEGTNGVQSHGNSDKNNSGDSGKANVPSLTVQEIVNRVRSNPGDPCILETQEPLQDLVRGVLKIFSSRTAPLGAKGWKALVLYDKSLKSWSWIGPVPQSSDQEAVEEVTSPDAWGLPHKMLVKLVDSFANWLKSGQETLQQIGSLPAPPLSLMQLNLDEKERFRDLRAQKSLNTINPCSEEVRDYFRKEEVLRYSIPDRAFSYTAVDGKKSIVAPLRRCGGKPTSKARDHFMLKRDRPPHVTILCLVRDAAARLPGSIGTRADVCTLIRDSQYIVEDVSDAQVNQVVSGALDRLHYERDPCVQFDGERKLWVYLHREREEEDFEDDGTSSTKKWKRQKKEAAEPSELGTVTVAYHGSSEQTGFDLSSDLNVEPSGVNDEKREDLVYYDGRHQLEGNFEMAHMSEQGAMHPGPSMVWEANPVPENKLLCQENSTNEDFDDETFARDAPAELLSTSLS